VRTRRIRMFTLTMAIGVLALGFGGAAADEADHPRPAAPAPAPNLTDVSATTQTPRLFTVTGTDFTPGGRAYLAVYDQMGAQLYETRWVTANPALPVEAGPTGHEAASIQSPDAGTLREAFANLCGAAAMMRAYDHTTATWSNWLTVQPVCDGGDGPNRTGRPY
jgi:hypothetical protein